MLHKLNPRELATVLAALRHWQEATRIGSNGDEISSPKRDFFSRYAGFFVTEKLDPLSVTEIDDLCERLNA